jgi:glycosyltransferase involved in cell wall biosynthesis
MAGFDFGRHATVVLDEHNLEYELLARGAAVEPSMPRRLFKLLEGAKVRREEIRTWKRVDGCLLVSSREQAEVRRIVPRLPTAVVPNGVDLDYFRPAGSVDVPDQLVFTGLMTYRPNADGVVHFIRETLPLVRRARPKVILTLVGWGLPDELKPLLRDGVHHTGLVDDVRPYLAAASVVVVPLRFGGGTRLKVLDALAMSKPLVSTSLGCEGIDAVHGEHLLIADDPATFADSVVRLLDDRPGAHAMGRRGRQLMEQRYGWETSLHELERFQQSLIRGGAIGEIDQTAPVAAKS